MKGNITKLVILKIIRISLLGLFIGMLGGLVAAAFVHLLNFVTNTREGTPWIILLLPLGGIVTVFIHNFCKMGNYGGTNEIILCVKHSTPIRVLAAPLIFVSTAITHLLGGSAGREGAALQLGGAGASAVADLLCLKNTERTMFVMCGMSAVFAGMFGTPITAAVFMLEFRSNKKLFGMAFLPCFISAIAAKITAHLIGVEEEAFHLGKIPSASILNILKIIVLALGISLLAYLMCFAFHKSAKLAKKLFSNPYIRTIIFSAVIIAMTAAVGDMRYNGSGMGMAIGAVEGSADWFDFLLKIAFTSITLAAGLKGGEIVPTFCIGATFGFVFGDMIGLSGGFAAALGLIGLFCAATNSPLSAILLGVELFGISLLPYYILICLLLWPISVKNGLFENRYFKPIFFKK